MKKRFGNGPSLERGFFVAIEGIDGSGKSTLSKKLAQGLKAMRLKVLATKAPGGTMTGDMIRSLVVTNTNLEWSATAELFMFLADRAEACEKLIKPALDEKKVVICDRFTGSTLAYQGYGRSRDVDFIARMEEQARGGVEPDMTLFIDIPLEVSVERAQKRNARLGNETRFENEGLAFMGRVHAGYQELARIHSWTVLDGMLDEDELARNAVQEVSLAMGVESSFS